MHIQNSLTKNYINFDPTLLNTRPVETSEEIFHEQLYYLFLESNVRPTKDVLIPCSVSDDESGIVFEGTFVLEVLQGNVI